MICLLQSFIKSLIVVLCYSPVGTMERVVQEGQVATAATHAHMFSTLPSCGTPTRLIVYDLHTLQNRFYLHTNAVADLRTGIPLLKQRLNEIQQKQQQQQHSEVSTTTKDTSTDDTKKCFCIAFPDDGAAKRFSVFFKGEYDIVVCGKTRQGDDRVVTIHDGPNVHDRDVVIVDDLVQSGGTLYETGRVLKDAGARSVHAYVTHAVFPNDAWKRFCHTTTDEAGDCIDNCFTTFWVTNSIPTVTNNLPKDSIFEVLDLMDLIVSDLDRF
jgi:Phosphoribosyl transferase domain